MKSRADLKGGYKTRRGGKEFNDKFDAIVKSCGCQFGKPCKCNKEEENERDIINADAV